MAGPVGVTWIGHATTLIEVDGARLMTDPVLRRHVGPLVRAGHDPDRVLIEPVDGVLLSHLHADHADLPTLRRLPRRGPVLAPSDGGRWLTRHGVRDVRELAPGEELSVAGVRIRATPARHDPRRRPFGPTAPPIGFLIQGSTRIYFAGDTDLFEEMADLCGHVDIALLPVWGWGPNVGPGHLDPARAAEAIALVAPTVVIPIHWGTFGILGMGTRSPRRERPVAEFVAQVRRRAPDVSVRVLAPGERAEFAPS